MNLTGIFLLIITALNEPSSNYKPLNDSDNAKRNFSEGI